MARNIRVYAFGIILGCLMSYFFLRRGEHDFTFWLPEQRVLIEISDSTIYSAKAECELECSSIDKKSIEKLLKDGDVDFSKSSTKDKPKIYYVEGESISGKAFYFKAKMLPRHSEIIEIRLSAADGQSKCDC